MGIFVTGSLRVDFEKSIDANKNFAWKESFVFTMKVSFSVVQRNIQRR